MSYIDRLLHQLQNPDAEPDDLDERIARWMTISGAKRTELIGKADTMQWVLALAEDQTRAQTNDGLTWLPPGKAQEAITELGVNSRMTLHHYIDKCRTFREKHADQPLALALVNMAGRKPNQLLTPEEQLFAIGAYLQTEWTYYLGEGRSYPNTTRVESIYIAEWMQHIFPTLAERLKPDGLERFLSMVVAEDRATFTLAWEGEQAVWARYLLKLPNNITEPNQVWQLDGRILPMIVLSEEGIPCTVTMIPVVDVCTLYTPKFLLVPRRVEDAFGVVHQVDFRYHDITMLLAIVMMMLRLRPGFLYTDNGSQFKALKRILSYLTNMSEDELHVILGFPYHPWGRGIVEVVQKLVDAVLRGQPGWVTHEKDPKAWEKARTTAAMTIADLETLLRRHFDKWNYAPRGDQPSRYDIWKKSPQTRRPMPAPERLFHLGFGTDWKTYLVRDTHIHYDTEYYGLKYLDIDTRRRWVDAVGKKVPVWSMDYYDDKQQRRVKRVFACFDTRTIDELVKLKSGPTPSHGQRRRNQQGELNAIRNRRNALQEAFLELTNRLDVATPAIDTVEKTVVYPRQAELGSEEAVAGSPPEPVPEPAGDHTPNVQAMSAERATPEVQLESEERTAGADTPPSEVEQHAGEPVDDQAPARQPDETAPHDAPDHSESSQDSPAAQPQKSTLAERLRQRRAQRNQQ